MLLKHEEVCGGDMVMFVRFNALSCVVNIDAVFLNTLKDVNIDRRWVNSDQSSG